VYVRGGGGGGGGITRSLGLHYLKVEGLAGEAVEGGVF